MRILAVLGAFLFLSSVAAAVDVTAEHYDKTFDISGKARLHVKNSDGIVRILAEPGAAVNVDVTKQVLHAKDEAQAKKRAEDVSVNMLQTGSLVEIRVDRPSFNLGIHIHEPEVRVVLIIKAPPDSDVEAHVGDGTLESTGFAGGDQQYQTSDGTVGVTDCSGNLQVRLSDGSGKLENVQGTIDSHISDGKLEAHKMAGTAHVTASDGKIHIAESSGHMDFSVGDGELRVTDSSGDARLSASDGNLIVEGFHGSVEATGHDGHVQLDGVFSSVAAKTSDGSLTVHASEGSEMSSNWTLESRDGDIALQLPESFTGDVEFTTRDGRITTDVPVTLIGSLKSDYLRGRIRESGHLLSIHTSDGDISVTGK